MASDPFKTTIALLLATLALATGVDAVAAATKALEPVTAGKATRLKFDIKSQAYPVGLNRAALARLAARDEMDFALPNGTTYTVVFDRIEDHGGGIRSTIGYLKDKGKDFRVIITTGPAGSFGTITTPETIFRIIPGDGHDWMVDETEERKLIPPIDLGDDMRRPPVEPSTSKDREALPVAKQSAKSGPGVEISLEATPTPQATIDLMIVYTNGLATRLGANLMTRLYNLVASANTAYTDSEVAITLRLVNATMVNYPDNTDDSAALNAISPQSGSFNPGVFGNIETIRNNVGADLVSFLRSGSDNGGSGIAWLSSTSPNAQYLYSTLNGCVVGCNSVFIHELGHNMGNAHDRATAAYQAGGTANPPSGAYPYSFGHYYCASGQLTCNPFVLGGCATQPRCTTNGNNVGNVGTIMSYFNPVTLRFSNPSLPCAPADTASGLPTQPCGVAGQEDNALSMNNMRNTLQGVKPTVVVTPPGAIQFAATSYTVNESGGSASIAVSRVGGSAGSVSVSYATSDGSAKAGYDYTAMSGTLTWADGDSADKIISVPIVDDGVTEGTEAFSVTLSNPTGATGIFLASPATASVQITEISAWPPGGTFPAGYSAPVSTSGVWAIENVAANCASSQSPCLGSPQVLATVTDFSTYSFADLNYTTAAGMPAGNVSFTYRVSSLGTSFANLQFLIDGVVAFSSAGGETGWLSASVAISSGSHTLTWRFRNRVYFACADAISPTPPPNCMDRGWIDNVSLPLVLSPSSTAVISSINPSSTGQSVTFTATASGGAGTPTGVMTFRDGSNIIAGCNLLAMTAGSAQCTTSALTQGTHSITAAYSGSTTYDVSTSPALTQTVNLAGFTLTVGRNGTGSGNVTSNPAGIDTAASVSSAAFATNAMVTLSQTPNAGSVFSGWSGDCTGAGACSVTMSAARNVTATFSAQCQPGTFSATGLAPCTNAAPGNFVAGVGATAQTQCAAGTYQPNSASTACLQASPGSFAAGLGNATQTQCAAGTYQPNAGAAGCVQTNMGFYAPLPGATAQTPCGAGTYQPNVQSVSCLNASVGNFVSTTGAVVQTPCSPGSYQPNTGATACQLAQPGFFVAASGATAQTACPAGTTSTTSGATACVSILPSAPGSVVGVPGNAQARIAFVVPGSDGGSPILDYTATCVGPTTVPATASGSPIVVTGLTNGSDYSCRVTARNANGSGPASATVVVTPQANAAIALNSVVSRKIHGAAGPQDIAIDLNQPIGGLVTVESRTIGAGHTLIFQFNNTVTGVTSASATTGTATATFTGTDNLVTVTLTGVPDAQRVTVSLAGVTGVTGSTSASASIGFLVGDVNNTRSVNASDIAAVKAASGTPTNANNFRRDLNAVGGINSADVSVVKSRSGVVLP